MKRMLIFLGCSLFAMMAFGQSKSSEVLNTRLVVATAMINNSAVTASDVVINPNPVKGESFSLELQNLDKGKYNIYIFNRDGKKFLVKTLNYEGGSASEILNLPEEITTGTYILQVLSKTSRFSKKMVVE